MASRVLENFRDLNRDIEVWLKSVMTPLEAQVREHQKQLRRRVDSIERIHEATDTLESRIAALEMCSTAWTSVAAVSKPMPGASSVLTGPVRKVSSSPWPERGLAGISCGAASVRRFLVRPICCRCRIA